MSIKQISKMTGAELKSYIRELESVIENTPKHRGRPSREEMQNKQALVAAKNRLNDIQGLANIDGAFHLGNKSELVAVPRMKETADKKVSPAYEVSSTYNSEPMRENLNDERYIQYEVDIEDDIAKLNDENIFLAEASEHVNKRIVNKEANNYQDEYRHVEDIDVMDDETHENQYNNEERPVVEGILEVTEAGYGFLRFDNFLPGDRDIYVSAAHIKMFRLKTGDKVRGISRLPRETDKFGALLYVSEVNGESLNKVKGRTRFEKLTPIFPRERIRISRDNKDLGLRLMELVAPIGKGQRGLIVAPPKAGKTTFLGKIAQSIAAEHPEVEVMVLLIGERPEEVTELKRSLPRGEVVYSTFDQPPYHHLKVAEMVLERGKRLVEHGKDAVILLDSLTRLTRANNLIVDNSGKILSGGLDPSALYFPKQFFGAARKAEEGGSLTILATCLVETGSRMDDIIFEEFKGTGNMELKLDRELQEKRIFPAIDISKSGTRREDLLMTQAEIEGLNLLKNYISDPRCYHENMEMILDTLVQTKNNESFLYMIKQTLGKKG